tara:strand:- start:217 stop:504 length:288 start_codon:yes stop_codon:yes gene_type:complete
MTKVGVDSGLIWIGDPCYIMGDDASDRVNNWQEFCSNIKDHDNISEPLGEGIGTLVSSGYGDGCYSVNYKLHNNRVASITVTFIDSMESDGNWYE